ncbi:RNA-directed RNA polymerase L [Frankliniella fusca]|uniref:RNA-directed RNA polymerase L n=1 Tax=Frankliniella fusca TaxID=407009 RepID=A0AAE1HN88_9NEOP|nr:RNA-directed RNA polymerase L [Frankliniella fusca]
MITASLDNVSVVCSSNAKRCKTYRENLTVEQKEMDKIKDRERKRLKATERKTGNVSSSKTLPNRSVKSVLKRRLANKVRMKSKRSKMTSDEIAVARAKDKLRKRVPVTSYESSICSSNANFLLDEGSETDRTYEANIQRKFQENFEEYGASNSSELYA